MAAKKKDNPIAQLGDKLRQKLESQRSQGAGSYPLTLKRLGELTDPAANPENLVKAFAKLKKTALAANPKDIDSPVVLIGDLVPLAQSALLLEYALRTAKARTDGTKKGFTIQELLAKNVSGKPLQNAFKEEIARQIREGRLPASIGSKQQGKKTFLYFLADPIPEPPRPLSDRMLAVLASQRPLGPGSYPLTLRRLGELTDSAANVEIVVKAFANLTKKQVALAADPKDIDTPVALDEKALANSELLVEYAMRTVRSKQHDTQAFKASDLAKAVSGKPLQTSFKEAIARRIAEDRLPTTMGWVKHDKDNVLFFLADLVPVTASSIMIGGELTMVLNEQVNPAAARKRVAGTDGRLDAASSDGAGKSSPRTPDARVAPGNRGDFNRQFAESFDRLDRQSGSNNFVSLLAMRKALATFSREEFDTGLHELRAAQRFGLSGAESSHVISAEQRQAGIEEDGSLLLYVKRKSR